MSSRSGCGYLLIHSAETYCVSVVCARHISDLENLEVKFILYYPLSPQELFKLFKSGRLRSQRAKLYDKEVALN